MFSESFKSLDYILHALVSALILVFQGVLLFRSDAPAFHLPQYSSMIGITAVILLLLLHITQAVRVSQGKKEGMFSALSRNILTATALSAEFAAFALDREGPVADQVSSLVAPVIILGSLSLMRVLDSLLDAHDDIKEAVSVQCVKDPFNLRVIMIHVLMLLTLGAQIVKRVQWSEETDAAAISKSADSLDIAALVLLSVHLGIYPLNALIRLMGADECLIRITYCCSRKSDKEFLVPNCENENGVKSRTDNNGNVKDVELVAITRIPLVRQLIAGVIIASNAYVLGAAYLVDEITYQIPATLLYIASDILGRNYL